MFLLFLSSRPITYSDAQRNRTKSHQNQGMNIANPNDVEFDEQEVTPGEQPREPPTSSALVALQTAGALQLNLNQPSLDEKF